MNHLMRIVGCVLLVNVLALNSATAEDRGAWFKSLVQPKSGVSCCDIADCHRAEADWRAGQWWAKLEGDWIAVPPERELNVQSIDGDAYVCSSPTGFIYCFVRPTLAI